MARVSGGWSSLRSISGVRISAPILIRYVGRHFSALFYDTLLYFVSSNSKLVYHRAYFYQNYWLILMKRIVWWGCSMVSVLTHEVECLSRLPDGGLDAVLVHAIPISTGGLSNWKKLHLTDFRFLKSCRCWFIPGFSNYRICDFRLSGPGDLCPMFSIHLPPGRSCQVSPYNHQVYNLFYVNVLGLPLPTKNA